MFELLYTSLAPTGFSEDELIGILEKARIKNNKLGITGMLIYHDREIMQILEGDKSTVLNLFQTIFEDSRHTCVDVFYKGEIKERSFSDWSMAFKSLDEQTIKLITDGYQGLDKNSSPINMLKSSNNRGKKTFISLRETFFS
ncbi:BLUF domain-containing protein [Colwellia sp. RE-S-Sl-9]